MIHLPDLYVTIDKESFLDVSIHIGRLRLELCGTRPGMADPLANQCTDARLEKVHQAFDLLLLLQREIPGQLVSTFLYIASHDGCHKQALEQELNMTTASSSRNTDWLSDGRMGIKHAGLGLITKEQDGRRQRLRLTPKGKALVRQMKSTIYG